MLLWTSLTAHAHVGALMEAIDMVLPGPAVAATFGLIVRDENGEHRWICHEAITTEKAVISPRYARNSEGVFLGVVPALEQSRDDGVAVYRSTDGCDWLAVDGLDEQVVLRAEFAPDNPDVALAISANVEGAQPSGIFQSTDGGQSFATMLSSDQRLFRSVRYSSGIAGHVFASAVWYETGEGWLYSSDDYGQTWQEVAVIEPNPDALLDVDVVAVSPTDPLTAWFVVGPYGNDTVYKTTDGGVTSTAVLADIGGDIIDGVSDADGGVWLVASGSRLFYAEDGENFDEVPLAPGGLGIAADGRRVYPTSMTQFTTVLYAHTDDQGQSFDGEVGLADILPPPLCPADSDVVEVCEPLWPILDKKLPEAASDTGEPSATGEDTGEPFQPENASEPTCGCASRANGTGLAVGLLAACLGWRRRW